MCVSRNPVFTLSISLYLNLSFPRTFSLFLFLSLSHTHNFVLHRSDEKCNDWNIEVWQTCDILFFKCAEEEVKDSENGISQHDFFLSLKEKQREKGREAEIKRGKECLVVWKKRIAEFYQKT